ncbi:MAG: nitrous oxide-stimulated promoter family protein [Bacteroidaceae bacterium]|nr:nitrous oxide-stimulated promoter family protein [Bacteroidaceae bacterium]
MTKIEREKQTVEHMIRLYCQIKEKNTELCEDCKRLLHYAHQRLDACRFGEHKSTCRKCSIHCYKPEMRQRIQEVMRFSGPKMLYHHPIVALKHLWQEYF